VTPDGRLKLISGVRDLQIVDSEGCHCGIVDDIEMDGRPGKPSRIKALVVGPGGYAKRLPGWAQALVGWLAGSRTVKVPWDKVKKISSRVELVAKAEELGLTTDEDKAKRLLPPVPAL
jgi:sporulation protein YlmC with PRC-barrel domain